MRTIGLIKKKTLIPALWIAAFTFVVGLFFSLGLESFIRAIESATFSFIALLVVILTGIVFDAIGTAAAAAESVPFNSMAARRVPGAHQAVRIVRNADLVANVTADVVGDIAGTLSGAVGAVIVVALMKQFPAVNVVLLGATMTSLIASATVGGKTIGKSLAINHANAIILRVGKLMKVWEDATGMELLQGGRR
ncbi:MAG: hypothetical protein ACM3QZ_06105 [Solirubrobacterales bacterium]